MGGASEISPYSITSIASGNLLMYSKQLLVSRIDRRMEEKTIPARLRKNHLENDEPQEEQR
jgi:hypothetical protein